MTLTLKQLLYSSTPFILIFNLSAFAAPPEEHSTPKKGHNALAAAHSSPANVSHGGAHVSAAPARSANKPFTPNRQFETHFSQQNPTRNQNQNHNYNHSNNFNNHFNNHNRTYAQPVYSGPYVTTYVAPAVVNDVNQDDGYVVQTTSPSPDTAEANNINQDEYSVVASTDTPPGQTWVAAQNGNVPNGAVPFQDENQSPQDASANNPSYYCRGQYNNQSFDGVLVAGEGCYVEDRTNAATIRLENYQVLVNN